MIKLLLMLLLTLGCSKPTDPKNMSQEDLNYSSGRRERVRFTITKECKVEYCKLSFKNGRTCYKEAHTISVAIDCKFYDAIPLNGITLPYHEYNK